MAGATKYQPYPAYRPSGVEWLGDIPDGWEATRLKQTVEQSRKITYGIVQAGPNLEVGIPYIRPADMTDESGIRDYSNLMRTSLQIAVDYERSKIAGGDLVCSIGPSFGKVMLVPNKLSGANLTQGTARIAINEENSPKFIFWVLRSPITFQQWESSVGGATFRALNLGPLSETYLSAPPLPEQTKIAAFLDYETAKIDALIAKQQQLIALLEEKRQAVISHAVTKGLDPDAPLRPSGIDWLGDVPAHWEITRVKFEVSKISDCLHTTPTYDGDLKYPAIRTADVERGVLKLETTRLVSEEIYRERIVRIEPQENDVLYSREGERFGMAALVPADTKLCLGQRMMMFRTDMQLDAGFFMWSLNGDSIINQVLVDVSGSTSPHINISDIRNFWMMLPPKHEQEEIVALISAKITKIDQTNSKAQSAITLLKERRTALISAAVTGKVDLRDWQPPEGASEQSRQDTNHPEEALA